MREFFTWPRFCRRLCRACGRRGPDRRGFTAGSATRAIIAVLILGVLPTVGAARDRRRSPGGRGDSRSNSRSCRARGSLTWATHSLLRNLDRNWDFYAWLARNLPNDARLLTTRPAVVASVAGIGPRPTSGRRVQVISSSSMPVYDDALRFLYHEDLAEMGITHLHLTDAWAQVLPPQARRLLDDRTQMQLLVDMRSVCREKRHRVFEVLPGAGTRELAPRELPVSARSRPVGRTADPAGGSNGPPESNAPVHLCRPGRPARLGNVLQSACSPPSARQPARRHTWSRSDCPPRATLNPPPSA